MKKISKWIQQHKVLSAVLLVIFVISLARTIFTKDTPAGYQEESVKRRDIVTYNSFVGKIEAVIDRSVQPSVSETVTEVLVKLGDSVEKGQPIAQLDTQAILYNISLKEASLSATQTANSYNVKDAQLTYDNYKTAVDSGLNNNLQAAQNQVDTSYSALEVAKNNYSNIEKAIDAGNYDGTSTAYNARKTAKENLDVALESLTKANSALEAANSDMVDKQTALDAAQAALDSARQDAESTTTESSLDSVTTTMQAETTCEELERTLSEAKTALENAKLVQSNCETAKISAQSTFDAANAVYQEACSKFDYKRTETLNNLQQQIDTAQATYDDALANYNAVALQVGQQLDVYAAAVEKTKATANTKAMQLELDNLRKSIEDYTITAPCSGTITALRIEEGDTVTPQTTIATISNLDSMEISIKVDEYSILNTDVGGSVIVYVDSANQTYNGVLTWVADTATIEDGVSYFDATVSFIANENVRSGMSVETRLVNVNELDVLSVGVDAVQYHNDNTAYLLVKNSRGEVDERDVTVGASDGTYVQIVEGVSEGETVLKEAPMFFDDSEMLLEQQRNSAIGGSE